MSCLKPKLLPNPRYKDWDLDKLWNYSNRVYGVPYPPNRYISIPCGRCPDCQKRRFSGYRFRLINELKKYPNSIFVTFTFDEPSLKRFRDNPNKALRLFLDRVRKKYGSQVRHWFVAEYGKKRGRLHYHGILFDCTFDNDECQRLWKYGNTFVGYANEITASYIVKYLTKEDTKGLQPPRVISSKGIGSNWLETAECKLLQYQLSTAIRVKGMPVPLPRYYIDKMYTEREKEIISYYNYMENVPEYWLDGVRYDSETSYISARNFKYKNYLKLGLISSEDYIKPTRISSKLRYSLYLDCLFEKLLNSNKL